MSRQPGEPGRSKQAQNYGKTNQQGNPDPSDRRAVQQSSLWEPETPQIPQPQPSQAVSPPAFSASPISPAVPPPQLQPPPRQRRRAAVEPSSATAVLRGQTVSYRVRISTRARVVRLVIRQESGLEIVVPRGTRRGQIEDALQQKAGWILRTMQRVARDTAVSAMPPLQNGSQLPFMGRTLTLAIVPVISGQFGQSAVAIEGRPRVTLSGETLLVRIAESERNNQDILRAALEGWYRRQARDLIPARLITANSIYGFSYKRVTIKEQKSRWGSCSRAGNLNFNWRLLLAPLPVLDYVLIHELAHLKELNHAPKFWRLVAAACPNYEAHRRWLREHGRTLRF